MIFAVVIMVTCSASGCIDLDAPKTDPEWSRAVRKGAMAKLELHVVEEDGKPVANANIKVIMGMIATAYTIYGQTDTNGVFIIKGKTKGNEIIISAKKDGYYNSREKLCFIKMGEERQVKNGKWQPYGEKVTVVLRKVKNTNHNLVNFGEEYDFKKTQKFYDWIGFDLEENDFVTPYGSGKVADFEVFIEWDYNTGEKYIGMALDIRFNEPYAGYYVVEKDKFSNFQGVYSAETNRTYITTERFFTKLIGNNERKRHKFDNSKCWIVRSRCVVDNEGKLVSANYSIISDFLYGRDDDDRNVFCIRLYGYFNPIPNDTNLEHKVQRWDYNGGEIMDKYY
jgi:hypothetical protein